jgi:hypothetical protein
LLLWASITFSHQECHNYDTEWCFSPFPPPHLMVNWYFYHQFSNFNECCHNLFNSTKYCVTCIIHDNTCNDNCHSKKYIFICGTHIRKWPHSLYHKNLKLFSFSFWLLFCFLCLDHYVPSSMFLFSAFDVYFLLLTTCVYSLPTCISHCNFSINLKNIPHLFHTS